MRNLIEGIQQTSNENMGVVCEAEKDLFLLDANELNLQILEAANNLRDLMTKRSMLLYKELFLEKSTETLN